MQDKIKDLSGQLVRQVYKIHNGQKLSPLTESIVIESDYIIMSCSNLSLINKYISPSKRTYILLDQSINSREYSKSDNDSVWYIPTDLKLPNLILADQMIYHVAYNLLQPDINIFNSIYAFFTYLIQKYVKKIKELEIDVFEPEFELIHYYSNEQETFEKCSAIMSDNYNFVNLFTSKIIKENKHDYKVLDILHIDYLDIIKDFKLNPVIFENNRFIELCIGFYIDIDSYQYKEVFNEISFQSAYNENFFDLNGESIIIKNEIIEYFDIKVDAKRRIDTKYLTNEANRKFEQSTNKSNALRLVFKYRLIDMKLTDFEAPKKLKDEEKEELLKQPFEDVDVYRTKQGIVAIANNPTDDLIGNKSINYVLINWN